MASTMDSMQYSNFVSDTVSNLVSNMLQLRRRIYDSRKKDSLLGDDIVVWHHSCNTEQIVIKYSCLSYSVLQMAACHAPYVKGHVSRSFPSKIKTGETFLRSKTNLFFSTQRFSENRTSTKFNRFRNE